MSPSSAKVAFQLFHGRKTPDEELDGWGRPGPVFLVDYVHVTYLTDIKLGIPEPAGDGDLEYVGDLVYYDGVYYGDWSVFQASLVKTDSELAARVVEYDASKARPPINQCPDPDCVDPDCDGVRHS